MFAFVPLVVDAGTTLADKDAAALAVASVTAQTSLTVAVIALVGVFATGVFTWLNTRKSATAQIGAAEKAASAALANARTVAYSSTVTSERSKWINALRVNIAALSGKLRTISYKSENGKLDADERMKAIAEINELISLVSLQLNPFGRIETNIQRLIQKLPALAERSDGTALRSLDALFIEHSRWLLKAEWDKVKAEARGDSSAAGEDAYIAKYDEFCTKEGAF